MKPSSNPKDYKCSTQKSRTHFFFYNNKKTPDFLLMENSAAASSSSDFSFYIFHLSDEFFIRFALCRERCFFLNQIKNINLLNSSIHHNLLFFLTLYYFKKTGGRMREEVGIT